MSDNLQIFANDLFCGSVAGVANCITGYPFEYVISLINRIFSSIKVRMQMSTHENMRTVISQTIKFEGFRGFYKGMGPPFVTVPLVNSVVFASFELCKSLMNVKSEKEFTFN